MLSTNAIFYRSNKMLNFRFRRFKVTAILTTIIHCLSYCSANTQISEQCDWTGSGLEMNGGKWIRESHDITPVYLRCLQGRVSWVHPRGGLRILLRPGSGNKDFRGCIKVNPTFAGARIYQGVNGKLKEIFSPYDGQSYQSERCFYSHNGEVVLYDEAILISSVGFPKYLAEFSYDLEYLPDKWRNSMNECQPCDEAQIINAFCTNELVATGSIYRIQKSHDNGYVEVYVKVDTYLKNSFFNTINYPLLTDNELGEDNVQNNTLLVQMKNSCKPQSGDEKFVFMARKKFDKYSLVCAPLWRRWKNLAIQENQNRDVQCILSY